MNYDAWKLATPPEYEEEPMTEPDEPIRNPKVVVDELEAEADRLTRHISDIAKTHPYEAMLALLSALIDHQTDMRLTVKLQILRKTCATLKERNIPR